MIVPTFKKVRISWSETIGIILGMVVGGTLSILLGALIINLILGAIGIGNLTYWQVAGLLLIWELIKPRVSSND